MSYEKVYQRKANPTKMDKEIYKHNSWTPETPAKPTQARQQQVYVKKKIKNVTNLPEKACNEAPTPSSEVESLCESGVVVMAAKRKDQTCDGTCLDSDGLINTNHSVRNWEVARSGSKDSGDSNKSCLEAVLDMEGGESASLASNSFNGVFNWQEASKETKDTEACTDSVAECLYFSSSGVDKGLDDGDAPLAQPCSLSSVGVGAVDRDDSFFLAMHTQIDRNTQKPASENFLLVNHNGLLLSTNSPESHLPQNDGQHLHNDVGCHMKNENGSVVSTPSQKTEQINNGMPLKKRPQKKSKAKKHTPKVVVEGKPKRTPKPKTPKRTPKPKTPKPATPKRPSSKKRKEKQPEKTSQTEDVISKFSSQKASIIEDVINEESCRRVLNFDLGNQSRDESSSTTVTHQYNNSKDTTNFSKICKKKRNKRRRKVDISGILRSLLVITSKEFTPKELLSNAINSSSSLQTQRTSMWMYPPRKTRTRKSVAVERVKPFKCLSLTQSVVRTKSKRSKRYRRYDLASLSAIPRHGIEITQTCDEQVIKITHTGERQPQTEISLSENYESYERSATEMEGRRLEDVDFSLRGPKDVDFWLTSKLGGSHAGLQEEIIDFIIQESESSRTDLIIEKLNCTYLVNGGVEHEAKKLEAPMIDLNLPIVDHSSEYLNISNDGHQLMEDHNASGDDGEHGRLVSCQEQVYLSKYIETELPIVLLEKDHNADNQCSTIVSHPIKQRKTPKRRRVDTHGPHNEPGALVPYQKPIARTKKRKSTEVDLESSALVPYQKPIARTKKKKSLVDLDSETLSLWNLLTNINEGKGEGKIDKENEKWWEREREVFRGRIDLFTTLMHRILGNRTFTKWKGSVVDSVIGVFLTQNVSDHLSSSAFMSLAARFPLQPTSNHGAGSNKLAITDSQESTGSNMKSDGLVYDLGGNQYIVTEPEPDKCHGLENRAETLVAGVEGTISVDIEDSGAVKDAVVTHISGGCCHLTPIFRSEADFASTCKPCSMESSTTSPDLQEIKHTTLLQESYCIESLISACDENNGCAALRGMEYGNQSSSLDRSNDQNGADASTSLSNSQDPFEISLYSADRPEILEDLGKSFVFTDCSSQTEVRTEKISQTCNSPQEGRTMNFQSQPISFVDGKVESQNSKMQPADDATQINKKRGTGKKSKSKDKTQKATPKRRGKQVKKEEEDATDWEEVRKKYSKGGPRSSDHMDSADWEAVRRADVSEIVKEIILRGQYNLISSRIKAFLDKVAVTHPTGIDLEWLRDLPPDLAKKYLINIKGLGLKSVECVRLLSLHQDAFPVDTNVGRIAVRLGWVPLQPLPEELQIHLLEEYPVLDSIQKYLWPRICTLDQRTLYELHYQMITFGKAFCTKRNPNCNACPMRGECKHFASAFASARLALPGPSEKGMVSSTVPIAAVENLAVTVNPKPVSLLEANPVSESGYHTNYGEPIIEEPASPKPKCSEISVQDIEDFHYDDPEEIPTINLNKDKFKANLKDYLESNKMFEDGNLSRALVALTAEAASIPTLKLKSISRLRTEHQVYVLYDGHPILTEILQLDQREKDDPSNYLLAIWTPGETADSYEPPKSRCNSTESELCKDEACFSCNSVRERNSDIVRGTIFIPCRTAMRGNFPLNGTYFQVNEVFADHETSHHPINVPRKWIFDLPRAKVHIGTSATTILRGLSAEEMQKCFWQGFICVRGFDREKRIATSLVAKFHRSPNKTPVQGENQTPKVKRERKKKETDEPQTPKVKRERKKKEIDEPQTPKVKRERKKKEIVEPKTPKVKRKRKEVDESKK